MNLIGKLTSSETAKETPPLEVPSNLVIIAPLKFADLAKPFALSYKSEFTDDGPIVSSFIKNPTL